MGTGTGTGVGTGVGTGTAIGTGTGTGTGTAPPTADPGPGTGRSYYATPASLSFRAWSLDITPDDNGTSPFPYNDIVPPYDSATFDYHWRTEDWDPALRIWTLPYTTALAQWARTVDMSLPSILAALEFGTQPTLWQNRATTVTGVEGWLEDDDLAWSPDSLAGRAVVPTFTEANNVVKQEIVELQMLMQDDRDRYVAEIDGQADGLAGYMMSFIGLDTRRCPWTAELISSGLAIGNIAYMYSKAYFKRVRPSFLCPALIPAFGPPEHPSVPSGHSFLGHFIALLLLEIPGLANRYGIFNSGSARGISPNTATVLAGCNPVDSPLLWLAQRLAKNRERLGVHYFSDSMASRHIAAGIWWALLHETDPTKRIVSPTLNSVLARAAAEWA